MKNLIILISLVFVMSACGIINEPELLPIINYEPEYVEPEYEEEDKTTEEDILSFLQTTNDSVWVGISVDKYHYVETGGGRKMYDYVDISIYEVSEDGCVRFSDYGAQIHYSSAFYWDDPEGQEQYGSPYATMMKCVYSYYSPQETHIRSVMMDGKNCCTVRFDNYETKNNVGNEGRGKFVINSDFSVTVEYHYEVNCGYSVRGYYEQEIKKVPIDYVMSGDLVVDFYKDLRIKK